MCRAYTCVAWYDDDDDDDDEVIHVTGKAERSMMRPTNGNETKHLWWNGFEGEENEV